MRRTALIHCAVLDMHLHFRCAEVMAEYEVSNITKALCLTPIAPLVDAILFRA